MPDQSTTTNGKKVTALFSVSFKRVAIFLILLLAITAVHYSGLAELPRDARQLQKLADSWGAAAPLGAVGILVLWIASGLPRMPASGLAGLVFGVPVGFLVAHVSVLVGNYIMYRVMLKYEKFLRSGKWADKHGKKLAHLGERGGLLDVIVIRLVPVAAVFQNIPLTVARPKPTAFWLGTLIGALPGTLVAVAIGAGLAEESLRKSMTMVIIALLALVFSSWLAKTLIAAKNSIKQNGIAG